MSKTLENFKMRTIESLKHDIDIDDDDKERRLGRLHTPLLNIELNNIIPDELHLLLRIMDILIRNLINAALTNDIQQTTGIKDPLERPMLKRLLQSIKRCGITFHVKMKENSKGFEFTSLTGGDKQKLLKKLPESMLECQPKEFCNTVKLLWEVCSYIYIELLASYMIQKNPYSC